MGVWHNRIIFDFFYSEYWHNRLVLSFSVKPEVGSFEGVWVCVLVIVFCVFSFTAIFPICFTKPLEVHNFPCTQEADRVNDVRIFDNAQDVVVGASGFLFRCDLVRTTYKNEENKADHPTPFQ